MTRQILGVGIFFVVLFFGLIQYFKHVALTSLTEFRFTEFFAHFFDFRGGHLSPYELSLFFTIFVMLQFWNMFNAKAFLSGKSAFSDMRQSKGFVGVCILISLGQLIIVTFAGDLFSIVPLGWIDWVIIFVVTSLVLWVGEAARLIRTLTK